MKMARLVVSGVLLFGCAMSAMGAAEVTIGTGSSSGIYYQAGRAICRLVNATTDDHGIICGPKVSDGSISNLEQIRDGSLEIGLAQSDWQYHAYNGTSKFEEQGKFDKLRAVFSVHAEPVTVIAHDDSGIMNITDVKGKRMNIGNPGSGTRGTWEVLEGAMGMTRSDLKLAAEMKSAETGAAICDGKIDAYFWLVGHPSALTQESLASCAAHLVNVTGPAIDKLIADNSYYRSATIPAGMYNNKEDITTFGVGATFVTSADVPDDVVYTVVKSVFENFDQFKKLHPAFANLKAEEMIKDGLSAPLHDGAVKYYKEKGWM